MVTWSYVTFAVNVILNLSIASRWRWFSAPLEPFIIFFENVKPTNINCADELSMKENIFGLILSFVCK